MAPTPCLVWVMQWPDDSARHLLGAFGDTDYRIVGAQLPSATTVHWLPDSTHETLVASTAALESAGARMQIPPVVVGLTAPPARVATGQWARQIFEAVDHAHACRASLWPEGRNTDAQFWTHFSHLV